MNWLPRANRRQSHTSEARVSASHLGDPPVGGQAADLLAERLGGEVRREVRLDRRDLGVPGDEHRPVVVVGRLQGPVGEALGEQPLLVAHRPGLPVAVDASVAEQELRQAVPGPGAVLDHVPAGPAQVPDGLLLDGGHPDGHELAGPVEPGQAPGVPSVGLHPVAGGLGDERGGDDVAGHAERGEQTVQVVAGGARLVARPEGVRGSGNRAIRWRTEYSSLKILSTSAASRSGSRTATEIESLWTSRPRWMAPRRETLGMAGSFRMLAPSACGWMIHADAERCRPFHAD